MLIDTHAHINGPEFSEDLPDVLNRAVESGVERIICVGYDLPTSERAVALADRHPALFAAVGLHPNSVAQAGQGWDRVLRDLAAHPRVVAIGETGLDYYRDFTPPAAQRAALGWHLDLANELDLPVIIHNRQANADITAELLGWVKTRSSPTPPGVLHSFAGDQQMMQACSEARFAISFSGMVTFSTRSLSYLSDVARQVPDEALLIETDSPYLAPAPFRGRRNEPAFVRQVASRLAELRDSSLDEIAQLTERNARRVFPLLSEPV